MATATVPPVSGEQESEIFADLRKPLIKLSRDLRQTSVNLSRQDARWITDEYYARQNARIRAAHQLGSGKKLRKPTDLVGWVAYSELIFEEAIGKALGTFARHYRVGLWLQSLFGIGDVLSAAMIANFDIRKAPSAGNFWSFAGLNPKVKWVGGKKADSLLAENGITARSNELNTDQIATIGIKSGFTAEKIVGAFYSGIATPKGKIIKGYKGLKWLLSRIPWNNRLKAIVCHRLGETLIKFKDNERCFYGQLFNQQKQKLWEENYSGGFAKLCDTELTEKNIGKDTEKYKYNSGMFKASDVRQYRAKVAAIAAKYKQLVANGIMKSKDAAAKRKKETDALVLAPVGIGKGDKMLAPGHIHDRARRWMVKLFISHLHEVMYQDYHDKPCPPQYILSPFAHPAEHVHKIEVPNWPLVVKGEPGLSLKEMPDTRK